MKMRPNVRANTTPIFAALLFLAACVLGIAQQRQQMDVFPVPRAQWDDATPLGGKGLRLLLQSLNYPVKRAGAPLTAMPRDAAVWLLLDPKARFSRREAEALLAWVRRGGTLVWVASPQLERMSLSEGYLGASVGIKHLNNTLGIQSGSLLSGVRQQKNELLPALYPLNRGAASLYWSGVRNATASDGVVEMTRPYLEIAGTPAGTQLARIEVGAGRVIVAPDALMFTNYALSKPDNAVLVTNLVRAHATPSATGQTGAVYFDERYHGEQTAWSEKSPPGLMYYLWQPPLRYAVLQLLGAALLWWALAGRRLGAPVPLPETEPVTRASLFALAMGALFQKVNRPRAAASTLGDSFRRDLTRRLGMSVSDADAAIAERAAAATGLPARTVDRLLLRAKAPAEHEVDVLSDAQEMELVLRKLGR